MFRALVGLVFIVLVLPSAALVASVVMKLLGVSGGLLGVVVGLPVFLAILTLAVIALAAINDRINNSQHVRKGHGRTHTNANSVH